MSPGRCARSMTGNHMLTAYRQNGGGTMCKRRFSGDGFVYDENDTPVSPLDDDYEYWKGEQDALTDPLSDDYCKYDNE